jgi:hypothetical protein|tara:strand:- start:260 stop:859 length:600 start_codon:yes stop_codon:yes gene_type:complete
MATTKVDICSTALILIGANTITSFSDDSTEANVCNVVYEDILKSSLTRHRWRFATEQSQLSLLTATPTGRYAYAYQLPTSPELLQLITLTVNDHVIPYERYGDKVYLDNYGSSSSVICDYTFRQDEAEFPPHFILALEYSLASLFAGSIARDSGMIRQFAEMAERQYLISKHIDSSERTTKVIDHSRFINLRQSTRSTG